MKKKITDEQISRAWDLAYDCKFNNKSFDDAVEQAITTYGLNENSAKIYLNNLSYIFEGKVFKRAMSARSFEIYWDEVSKLGKEYQERYIKACSEHLEYNSNKKAQAFINKKRQALGHSTLEFQRSKKKVQEQKEETLLSQPTNRILYGPPGTGKTYSVVEEVVSLLEPAFEWETREELQEQYQRLVDSGQVVFTTFHQSFSYEDFIEGIRAKTSDDKEISYEVESGVFKALCEKAGKYTVTNKQHLEGGVGKRKIWKLSLGNTQIAQEDSVYDHCIANNEVLLGWGDDVDFSKCTSKDAIKKQLIQSQSGVADRSYAVQAINTFRNTIAKGDLIVISQGNHKYRAVAEVTGDYAFRQEGISGFHQSRPVRWLLQYNVARPKEDIFKKDLSQMSLYQLHNRTIDRAKLDALLSDDASEEQDKDYAIVIDEINRGNISKIFGELITLIESSKREGQPEALSVTLPYSKEPFFVPSNLHIIGTMNTADRSLALIDTALRRRFDFIEMMPDYSLLAGKAVKGIELERMLSAINQRIEYLYDREHTIGHAFLIPVVKLIDENQPGKAYSELVSVFHNKILPLLEEYFYEDWQRIALVLGDNQKSETEHQFVVKKTDQNADSLFGKNHQLQNYGEEKVSYQLNPKMSEAIPEQAFIGIYDAASVKPKSADIAETQERAESQNQSQAETEF